MLISDYTFHQMKRYFIFITISFLLNMGCQTLPAEKYVQFKMSIQQTFPADSLYINLTNPLKCPLRISAQSKNVIINEAIARDFPLILDPESQRIIRYQTTVDSTELQISYQATMGNPRDSIYPGKLFLPFPLHRNYKIIQGYNGKFSHQSDYSRYALDFSLKTGDTICAAMDGFVVGVIKDYQYGGKSGKWREYANFITLFHPSMNVYSQYVHLKHQGSLVEVGDFVEAGTPIGLSGNTGYTDGPHLHFNVLRASEDGMISIPVEFQEGYRGEDLRKGDKVSRKIHSSPDQIPVSK